MPTISGAATDGDLSNITWNTSDQIVLTDADFVIATGEKFLTGTTQWTDAATDKIDGEQIADDTIDDDALDLTDITLADFTNDLPKTIQIYMDYPDGGIADTAWFFTNFVGASITIDSIHVESSVDNANFSLCEKSWAGGGNVQIDDIITSTNGTGCFYTTDIAVVNPIIEANHKIGLLRTNDSSDYALIVIYY